MFNKMKKKKQFLMLLFSYTFFKYIRIYVMSIYLSEYTLVSVFSHEYWHF